MIGRFLIAAFCGLISAGLTTWVTTGAGIPILVGICVTVFVLIFGSILVVMVDE